MAEKLEVQFAATWGSAIRGGCDGRGASRPSCTAMAKQNVCLAIPADQVGKAVRHGGRLVNLTGAVTERAFIRDLQWDTFGLEVLHVDLTRVSEHEIVEVHVAIELRGEAPGAKAGGVIEHLIHEVAIPCEVTAIPEKLHANINHLNLGHKIKIGDLECRPRSRSWSTPTRWSCSASSRWPKPRKRGRSGAGRARDDRPQEGGGRGGRGVVWRLSARTRGG